MSATTEIGEPLPAAAIPGPRGLPVLGSFLDMRRDKLGFLRRCVDEFGGIFAFRLGSWPAVFLSDPDLIQEVASDPRRILRKSRFLWRQTEAVFGDGILPSHGPAWSRRRRTMTPAFSARRVEAYAASMVAAAERAGTRWTSGGIVDAHAEMLDLALRVSIKSLFDVDVGDDATVERLAAANGRINAEIRRRLTRPFVIPDAAPWPGHRRYLAAVAEFDAFIEARIAERRGAPGDRGDFLSTLLAAVDEDGNPVSDAYVRDETINILAAAHDTTAAATAWALHLLATHPEVQEAVAAEAAALDPGSPADGMLRQVPTTLACVRETLRLYPSVWLNNRQTVEDMRIGGHPVAAGTSIYFSPWIQHRDPSAFPEPEAFRPGRWSREFERGLHGCAYMPFGYGPRLCIGRTFALQQMTISLALLVRAFRFAPADGKAVLPEPSIALAPRGGVRLRVETRVRALRRP